MPIFKSDQLRSEGNLWDALLLPCHCPRIVSSTTKSLSACHGGPSFGFMHWILDGIPLGSRTLQAVEYEEKAIAGMSNDILREWLEERAQSVGDGSRDAMTAAARRWRSLSDRNLGVGDKYSSSSSSSFSLGDTARWRRGRGLHGRRVGVQVQREQRL